MAVLDILHLLMPDAFFSLCHFATLSLLSYSDHIYRQQTLRCQLDRVPHALAFMQDLVARVEIDRYDTRMPGDPSSGSMKPLPMTFVEESNGSGWHENECIGNSSWCERRRVGLTPGFPENPLQIL